MLGHYPTYMLSADTHHIIYEVGKYGLLEYLCVQMMDGISTLLDPKGKLNDKPVFTHTHTHTYKQ